MLKASGAALGMVTCTRWKFVPGSWLLRIIAEQILRAQVVADARKGLVEPAVADVKALAAGLLGQGDERVLAAQVAAGAGLDGHVDDGVDHHLVAQSLLKGLGVGGAAGGIVAVGDQHQHLAPLLSRPAVAEPR